MRKIGVLAMCAVLASSHMSGCGGGTSSSSVDSYVAENAVNTLEYTKGYEVDVSDANTVDDTGIDDESRGSVRIYTGNMDLESVKFDESMLKIEGLVEDSGGYFQNKDVYTRSYGNTDTFQEADMTIRVPAAKFSGLIESLADSDEFVVVRQNVSSDDVSEQYYDIETRLNTARNEVKRLTELLDEAENVSDVISVENALSDATYNVEYLQGQLNGYNSRIQYSCLNLTLSEVTALTMTAKTVGYGSKLAESFVRGFTGGIEFIGNLILVAVGNWVVLGLFIGLIMLLRFLRRRRKRR